MANLNPNDALKQSRDAQGKPDAGPRVVWKRPRISAPMPTPSPHEERVRRESRRLLGYIKDNWAEVQ